MNHLYINNCSVDSLGDLKSLMDKFRVAKDDDPLFIDLIDNFVDGNIEVFLRTIGENELAERIKNIDTANGDSQIKQELIKDVCDVEDNITIDPFLFFKVEKAAVEDDKALFKVKVIKKAVEKFNIVISAPQIQLFKSKLVNIKDYNIGEIISLEKEVPKYEEEYDVAFLIEKKVVKKDIVRYNRRFSINGVDFTMIKVEDEEMGTFYIGETQVTQSMWKAVRKRNPSCFKSPNRPVERVSWGMCKGFISTLNEKLVSQIPKGFCFAVPTEKQWEYAAKGGKKSRGYQYGGCNEIKELKKHAWYEENANGETHDVKTREPNELKIYDMSGNVWEWCEDHCGPDGVLRGGSWMSDANSCSVTSRYYHSNYYNDYDYNGIIGLRLALVKKTLNH